MKSDKPIDVAKVVLPGTKWMRDTKGTRGVVEVEAVVDGRVYVLGEHGSYLGLHFLQQFRSI